MSKICTARFALFTRTCTGTASCAGSPDWRKSALPAISSIEYRALIARYVTSFHGRSPGTLTR
jgi:hypothetical protein